MAKVDVAKLFQNGRSQAVRLPRQFRFEGSQVRIRRVGKGVILEPFESDVASWYQELDRFGEEPLLPKGRNQPVTPLRKMFK